METQTLPYIPENAPFNAAQRAWLNGFLAGLFSGAAQGALAPAAAAKRRAVVLFGSQSGTSEKLAKRFAALLKQAGHESSSADMAGYSPARLAEQELAFIVTSTYGEGEPPDNARALHRQLHAPDALRLESLRYAVLSIGDSSYEKFCQCGVDFDTRLEELGAKRLTPRVDADVDYEASAKQWQDSVLAALKELDGKDGKAGGTAEAAAVEESTEDLARTVVLRDRRALHGPGSEKDTRHIVFEWPEGAPAYEVGDALSVRPKNAPAIVQGVLDRTGFSADLPVTLSGGEQMSLAEALESELHLGRPSLKFLRAYAELGGVTPLRERLDLTPKKDLETYLWGRDVLDILEEYPGVLREPADLVALLPGLAPRLYSIASSPRLHPREIHLTLGVVRYETRGRMRQGACSGFLAEHAAVGGETRVALHRNPRFRVPADPARPMILVGPGTGIAPFRGFLQDREAAGATGPNWLFFGNPKSASDFLYRDEIETWKRDGLLTRLDLAFSRDQAEKVYVQHAMRANADELWKWLEDGAAFYVCGDASRMAKDVETTLLEIIAAQGGLAPATAQDYLDRIKAEGRYQRDVY